MNIHEITAHQWIAKQRVGTNYVDLVGIAIAEGNIPMLDYLKNMKCPWPNNSIELAILAKNLEVCKWLIAERAFPYSTVQIIGGKCTTIYHVRVCTLKPEHLELAAQLNEIDIGRWIVSTCLFEISCKSKPFPCVNSAMEKILGSWN